MGGDEPERLPAGGALARQRSAAPEAGLPVEPQAHVVGRRAAVDGIGEFATIHPTAGHLNHRPHGWLPVTCAARPRLDVEPFNRHANVARSIPGSHLRGLPYASKQCQDGDGGERRDRYDRTCGKYLESWAHHATADPSIRHFQQSIGHRGCIGSRT